MISWEGSSDSGLDSRSSGSRLSRNVLKLSFFPLPGGVGDRGVRARPSLTCLSTRVSSGNRFDLDALRER